MAEQMKPSGVPWIGEIPQSWTTKRIKYVIDGIKDGTHGTFDRVVDGYYLLSAKNVFDDGIHINDIESEISYQDYKSIVSCGYPKKGDVLLCCVGTVGRTCVYLFDESYAFQRSVSFLRPSKKTVSEYLKYCLQSDSTLVQEQLLINKAAQDGLYMNSVKEIVIPYVSDMNKQQAIADYLDSQCAKIDSIIADIEKQIELLKQYKKSLITETVTKGLDKSVPMKDSGIKWIGQLPVNWKLSRVKYLVDNNHPYPIGDGDHGMIKADDYLDDGIPYIRVLNLTWGNGLKLDDIVFISNELNDQIKSSELKPKDILIAKTGATIGKTAIVPNSLPISNTTSHVGKITLPDTQDSKYFYYVFTSQIIQKQIQDISAMQSTRPELGIDGLKNLTVMVPSLGEQKSIAAFLDKQCEKIDSIISDKQQQLDTIQKHKKSLIYEYVTGKKRVKEAM